MTVPVQEWHGFLEPAETARRVAVFMLRLLAVIVVLPVLMIVPVVTAFRMTLVVVLVVIIVVIVVLVVCNRFATLDMDVLRLLFHFIPL